MSGLIGGILREHLEKLGRYELSALNRRPVEGIPTTQADLGDGEAIKPAFAQQDVVVHLAAQIDEKDRDSILRINVMGTYNVFEASRLAGVKRIVYASSVATCAGWVTEPPYEAIFAGRYDEVPETWPMLTHDMVRARGLYGASKVWGEALGRHYADAYGISVLCVRLGRVRAENRPVEILEYSAFLSHRDTADFIHRCIEAPDDLKYDIFFAASNNKWAIRDIEHPREVLGYIPRIQPRITDDKNKILVPVCLFVFVMIEITTI